MAFGAGEGVCFADVVLIGRGGWRVDETVDDEEDEEDKEDEEDEEDDDEENEVVMPVDSISRKESTSDFRGGILAGSSSSSSPSLVSSSVLSWSSSPSDSPSPVIRPNRWLGASANGWMVLERDAAAAVELRTERGKMGWPAASVGGRPHSPA